MVIFHSFLYVYQRVMNGRLVELLDWIHLQAIANLHLVVEPTPPKNHGVKVSWDDYSIPN